MVILLELCERIHQSQCQIRCKATGQQKNLYFLYIFYGVSLQLITLSSQKQNKTKKMNIVPLSEQSSSQCSKQEQEPDLSMLQKQVNEQLDPEQASKIISKIASFSKQAKNDKFESCLRIVVKLIQKGYSREVSKFNVIVQAMMDGFAVLARETENISKCQLKLMCSLSVVAQLIKSAPQIQIFMKKRFIQSLLLVDNEVLQVSPLKKDILAVLGVLYECIAKQTRILKKFQLLTQFKQAILSVYGLIEQKFSLLLFNKALYNLAVQGEILAQSELKKYGVFSTLSKIIGVDQASNVIQKIQQALKTHNCKKIIQIQDKRSEMVAESS